MLIYLESRAVQPSWETTRQQATLFVLFFSDNLGIVLCLLLSVNFWVRSWWLVRLVGKLTIDQVDVFSTEQTTNFVWAAVCYEIALVTETVSR